MLFNKDEVTKIKEKKYFTSLKVYITDQKYLNDFKKFIKKARQKGIIIENATKIKETTIEKKEYKNSKSYINKKETLWWNKYWKEMPYFKQENNKKHFLSTYLYFNTEEDLRWFSEYINQTVTKNSKFIHFPYRNYEENKSTYWIAEKELPPEYPVYIISKGRAESRLTVKLFEKTNVPYHIVIEPQEYDDYAQYIDEDKILTLPFSNLGQGSIPARNWVWNHAQAQNSGRHWIIDDNIRDFYRLHNNKRYRVYAPNMMYAMEQFVDRYQNIGIAGPHYKFFHPDDEKKPPFFMNTRVYSFILINNNLDQVLGEKWRGLYNEDTDLCLRVLKKGYKNQHYNEIKNLEIGDENFKTEWCTILFNTFLADKIPTLTMKGGNEKIYKDTNNRLEFAQSLKNQHPDCVDIITRWGRKHHLVNYSKFKYQKPNLKPNINLSDQTNEFGLKLIHNEN